MRNLKYNIIILFFLLPCIIIGQNTSTIKVNLKDAYTGKTIRNAKVTLEGFDVNSIKASYDKKTNTYFFKKIDGDKYNLVYVEHPKKEPQIYKKDKNFPTQINIRMYQKGIRVKEDTIYYSTGSSRQDVSTGKDTIIKEIEKDISAVDHYKRLIMFKNSSNLTYAEIRKKIDSIVGPYGLEYIEDIEPKMYFVKMYSEPQMTSFMVGGSSVICNINENKTLLDFLKEESYRVIIYDEDAYFFGEQNTVESFFGKSPNPFKQGGRFDWSKNCYVLPYRKKNKKEFRLENDPVLNKILKNNNAIIFGKIEYNQCSLRLDIDYDSKGKILISEEEKYKVNLSPQFFKEIDDKMMNYQFLKQYKNDLTRMMLMDFDVGFVHSDENKLRTAEFGNSDKNGNYNHYFLLDKNGLLFKKSSNMKKIVHSILEKNRCYLERKIAYNFEFNEIGK